jgi:hypothetical protein
VAHPQAWITAAAHELTSPLRIDPFASTAGGVRAVTASRNGLLLLGSALALLVVALASGSLFRLLRQMEGVRLR